VSNKTGGKTKLFNGHYHVFMNNVSVSQTTSTEIRELGHDIGPAGQRSHCHAMLDGRILDTDGHGHEIDNSHQVTIEALKLISQGKKMLEALLRE